jgi:hypothetical protein
MKRGNLGMNNGFYENVKLKLNDVKSHMKFVQNKFKVKRKPSTKTLIRKTLSTGQQKGYCD